MDEITKFISHNMCHEPRPSASRKTHIYIYIQMDEITKFSSHNVRHEPKA